ncbi:MAG: ABC transporter permease [Bacillota bacterium]
MNGIVRFWSRVAFGVQQALNGLSSNRLRSLITVLGVTIGVASVVSLVAVGEGARMAIVRQFESLGTNIIKVESHHQRARLTLDDAVDLQERVPDLVATMPVVRATAQVRWRRGGSEYSLLGVNEHFPVITDQTMAAGRFFSHLHVKERLRVAVVGRNVVTTLFQGRNPVGQRIYLGGQQFTVIGVLNAKGAGMANDVDNRIIIPVTTAQRLTRNYMVNEVWAKAQDQEHAKAALVQISRIYRNKLGITDNVAKEEDYWKYGEYYGGYYGPGDVRLDMPGGTGTLLSITSLNEMVEEASKANRVMTLMLGSIAGVSLLVGGLGIMNIMLVAVTERTSEIGLRKAVGARRTDLLFQFLVEAFVLSALGGLVGLSLGYTGTGFLLRYGVEAELTWTASWVALAAALGVGVVFGAYPAHVASGLAPVEALRRQ